jgi:WD40 repeat protein
MSQLIEFSFSLFIRGHEGAVTRCTFNKFERLYATCSWDKTVLLYDATTGSFRWATWTLALAIQWNSVGVQINEMSLFRCSSFFFFFLPAEHVNCSIDMYIYSIIDVKVH